MLAEILSEMARSRGASFDKSAKRLAFARAALADAGFRAKIAEVHRRLKAELAAGTPRKAPPVAPLFRDLEQEAERVLSRGEP